MYMQMAGLSDRNIILMHSGPCIKSIYASPMWPAQLCTRMSFLIMTDTYVRMYVHHENRSLIQSLALMPRQ